ncbi:hypothetical protein CHY_1195 [Carboxydothermus hydrogenoformans Z-2901]|uniref:Uncharacterized protein n=1 Tax=Carboxydothermus hydrogenoformans (strain ATCC BAA-161 / DSM 6008 / Z-2901) TaxID=246194 RepID=Q3ACU4_CARHZ|nr:hypothetical protein CHY_1195 [Carboxydothermus hydrogenoformans Z-2901]
MESIYLLLLLFLFLIRHIFQNSFKKKKTCLKKQEKS